MKRETERKRQSETQNRKHTLERESSSASRWLLPAEGSLCLFIEKEKIAKKIGEEEEEEEEE